LTRRTYPKYPDVESALGLVNPAVEPYSSPTIGAEAGQRYGAARTWLVWQVWRGHLWQVWPVTCGRCSR